MLKKRVITAVVLLALVLAVLYAHSLFFFVLVAAIFFIAAMWESARLFKHEQPLTPALLWGVGFIFFAAMSHRVDPRWIFVLSIVFWAVCFIPLLGVKEFHMTHRRNRSLHVAYDVSVLSAFLALLLLFEYSLPYLLSTMMVVWIADVGAYFAGKAYGRHKLAPTISPGKSWEGVVGGWLAVLGVALISTIFSEWSDNLPNKLQAAWGWIGMVGVITGLVALSVAGDLFESYLKRRAGLKDSGVLLPGHGGVLDRMDALIPVLPVAAVLYFNL